MKKVLLMGCSVLLSLCLSACIAIGDDKDTNEPTQAAKFNTTVTTGDFEIVVNSDILTAEQLNGDTDQYDEFLTTDMTNYGDTTLCDVTLVPKEGHIQAVVEYSIKNIGKKDSVFDKTISLNYNDGFTYNVNEQYWIMDKSESWHEFTSVTIAPLSTLQCKAYFVVPEEVFSNKNSSLKLNIGNCEYTVR